MSWWGGYCCVAVVQFLLSSYDARSRHCCEDVQKDLPRNVSEHTCKTYDGELGKPLDTVVLPIWPPVQAWGTLWKVQLNYLVLLARSQDCVRWFISTSIKIGLVELRSCIRESFVHWCLTYGTTYWKLWPQHELGAAVVLLPRKVDGMVDSLIYFGGNCCVTLGFS